MEKWKIVGFRQCDFKGNDGQSVSGWKFYLARVPENKNIFGLETHSLFVFKDFVNFKPEENIMVMITYNRFGKVASIVPVEA